MTTQQLDPENDAAPQKPASSDRKIAASRSNGAQSTGPATPEGKAASAAAPKNFRHGMLAQTVVLACESRARFEALLDSLLLEHRPQTKSERALVDTLAVARWRQLRTWSIQKNDFDREIAKLQSTATHPTTAPVAASIAYRNLNDGGNSLSNAIRHEATFDRQFNRSLRELKFLQNNRPNTIEPYDPTPFDDDSADATFENVIFPFDPNPKIEHPWGQL